MLCLNAANFSGKGFDQCQFILLRWAVFANWVEAIAQQIIKVFDRKLALVYFFGDFNKRQRLCQRIVVIQVN